MSLLSYRNDALSNCPNRPMVNTIANLTWVFGRSICCCVWRPPRTTTTIASTGERELASAPSVLSAPADAERRRFVTVY